MNTFAIRKHTIKRGRFRTNYDCCARNMRLISMRNTSGIECKWPGRWPLMQFVNRFLGRWPRLGKRRTFGPKISASRMRTMDENRLRSTVSIPTTQTLTQLHQIRTLRLARIVIRINPVLCIEMFVVHAVVVIGKLLGQAIRPTLFRNGL